jgi:hypothetical protein
LAATGVQTGAICCRSVPLGAIQNGAHKFGRDGLLSSGSGVRILGGEHSTVTIAESDRTIVVEGNRYFTGFVTPFLLWSSPGQAP